MPNDGEADRSVRIVGANAQADESVFVVNNLVVAGSPSPGDVPVVQADGSLAWGAGGGGGGGLTLGSYADFFSGTQVIVPMDGAGHSPAPGIVGPPTWLDPVTNDIIEPGLYQVEHDIAPQANATVAGKVFAVTTAFNDDYTWSYDIARVAFGIGAATRLTSIQSLGLADLSFSIGPFIRTQVDATGSLGVTTSICRLAH